MIFPKTENLFWVDYKGDCLVGMSLHRCYVESESLDDLISFFLFSLNNKDIINVGSIDKVHLKNDTFVYRQRFFLNTLEVLQTIVGILEDIKIEFKCSYSVSNWACLSNSTDLYLSHITQKFNVDIKTFLDYMLYFNMYYYFQELGIFDNIVFDSKMLECIKTNKYSELLTYSPYFLIGFESWKFLTDVSVKVKEALGLTDTEKTYGWSVSKMRTLKVI